MTTRARGAHGFARSPCPTTRGRWATRTSRSSATCSAASDYSELLASPERIPTNLLAERLERLERAGLICSAAYQERPVRYAYTLTDKGKALRNVLKAYVAWGKRHIPCTRTIREIEEG